MTKTKQLILVFSVMLLAIVALVLLWVTTENEPVNETVTPAEAEGKKVVLNIKAVGDNLIHSPIFNACKTEDGYNFDGLYVNIAPHIKDADIAAINQETIFVDENSSYSGYPTFGSPHQVGESVYKAGFNTITHATNHTYDRRADAILYSMDFWDKYDDVTVLGINRSVEEQNNVEVFEKDGLSVAMLNFTYGLNGFSLPDDMPYLVNLLSDEDLGKNLLIQAENKADITVVFVHFGTEYVHAPTSEQIETVEFLCSNGADVIIGTHPHVVQPMTKHTAKNGNEAVVYYSLGNFVSNQSGASKILGAMADVTIVKEDGVTRVESYEMHPTVTHCSGGIYTVYMLDEYSDDLAAVHKRAPGLTVEKLQTLYDKIINIEVKEAA